MNHAAPPNKKRPSTRPSNGGQTKINQMARLYCLFVWLQPPRMANHMRQDTRRGHFTSSAAHC